MKVNFDELPQEAKTALEQFPEFELLKFNDSGANGFVLIGRHSVLKKDVAIKIYFHDEHEIDQEPTIISKINHENVLKVYDVRKVARECSYFLMPAANDGDLSNYLDNYDISLPLAHKLLCQLLSGISALHAAPNFLVHRDLKPENLLIHDDTLVIADFGSVRRIDEATQKAPASKHSVLYRPAEAFGGNAYFNFSSDVYQAGLVGFQLLGGTIDVDLLTHLTAKEKKNFLMVVGDYEKSVFIDNCIKERVEAGRLVDWKDLPFYVPSSIKRALKTALSPIEKRYKNGSEFLAELARLRGNLPDWLIHKKGYILRNWKGLDYLICDDFTVMKRKRGNKNFRTDNSFVGKSIEEIYDVMKVRLRLP